MYFTVPYTFHKRVPIHCSRISPPVHPYVFNISSILALIPALLLSLNCLICLSLESLMINTKAKYRGEFRLNTIDMPKLTSPAPHKVKCQWTNTITGIQRFINNLQILVNVLNYTYFVCVCVLVCVLILHYSNPLLKA